MQIKPQEIYPIVRQLDDPNDSATYYVQAKVRNAETDALLDTLNLVDKGNQRFVYQWTVPADPSGEGFYIDIQTIVYTNSGYTTVAERYGRENVEHLIQERQVPPFGGGGGDISYTKLREVVREVVDSRKIEKVDLGPVVEELRAIKRGLGAINLPEVGDCWDISPVIEALSKAQRAIQGDIKAIPTPIQPKLVKEIDLGPILFIAQSIDKNVKNIPDLIVGKMEEVKIREKEKAEKQKEKKIVEKKEKQPERVRYFSGNIIKVQKQSGIPKRIRRTNFGFGTIEAIILIAISLFGASFIYRITSQQPTASEAQFRSTQSSLPLITATTSPYDAYTVRTHAKNLYFPYSSASTSRLSVLDANTTGSTKCLQITSAGWVETAADACGSVGSATSTEPFIASWFVATSTTINSNLPRLISTDFISTNATTTSATSTNLYVSGQAGIGIAPSAAILSVVGATNPEIRIGETDLASYFSLQQHGPTRSQVSSVNNGAGVALIDFDPLPSDGSSNASFRFFRITNTSGVTSFTVHKGDGTAAAQHNFRGNGSSYLQNDSGTLTVGPSVSAALGTAQLSVKGNAAIGTNFYNQTTPTNALIVEGNLGIGTTTPYAKLSVVGETVSAYFTATSTSANSNLPNLIVTNSTTTSATSTSFYVSGDLKVASSTPFCFEITCTTKLVYAASGTIEMWIRNQLVQEFNAD